ncbi:MAG: hypothetical protein P8R42_16755 [Candidatus Binatia bacterium]|nr:hypothetical protein [Candidatus Binatia bacterium]
MAVGAACSTIPGETFSSFYWSSSTVAGDPSSAWGVTFDFRYVFDDGKDDDWFVRAAHPCLEWDPDSHPARSLC